MSVSSGISKGRDIINEGDALIQKMQGELAQWMCELNMQEAYDFGTEVWLSADSVRNGYEIMMCNLMYLDVLRSKFERLQKQN